jgi:hypothetical protein
MPNFLRVTSRLIALLFVLFGSMNWGFYAHKSINYHAVFVLPPEMYPFYRKHIFYLKEHAVDADKRRYISEDEAPRHYLDADVYEQVIPLDTIPRYWDSAVAKYGEDSLLKHGIGPWHLNRMVYRLTKAFEERDFSRILRLSSDIGHYVGDLHVPLHTTKNYNGQLTHQHGIHGFWESRLPELFASDYDFFVGPAEYVPQVNTWIWERFTESFAAKDSVLWMEARLHKETTEKKKYSMETRGNRVVRVYSKSYSEDYHALLQNMVERRMAKSIHMTASLWMTAWVNAGQPVLDPAYTPQVDSLPSDSLINHLKIKGRMETH